VIRVFIIAASPLARAGLENLLIQTGAPSQRRNLRPRDTDAATGVEVVGSGDSIDALEERQLDGDVDIVLIDASGFASNSMLTEIADAELAADLPMVLLSDHVGAEWHAQALHSGVRAILPADATASQLLAAIQGAAAGLVVLHPADVNAAIPASVVASTASVASVGEAELTEPLTRREREVLQMLAAGLGNKEIAARLSISDHTAKFHVASILGKLGASTRTEAVALGIRRGLILL